jgi:pyridoxine 5'-phosphate synthase PdxJ
MIHYSSRGANTSANYVTLVPEKQHRTTHGGGCILAFNRKKQALCHSSHQEIKDW